MKTSIATTLSVVGVLAAGAAAYAVNTSVTSALGGGSEIAPSAVVNAPVANGVPAPIDNVTNAAVRAQQSTTSDAVTTYTVGGAGSVVIDTSSGRAVVTSILPAEGFTSEPARTNSDGTVIVHFVSSTQRIEFKAQMLNGAVVTDVVNERPPASVARPRHDDDEHEDDEYDEDHEDDEHEDDEYENEDDD